MPFPFPATTASQQVRIRAIAEELDGHRKRQQAVHPKLTLTDMYNVLEKLRSDEPLSVPEKAVHEQGLVTVLRQLHDELDAAVFDAYGWPADGQRSRMTRSWSGWSPSTPSAPPRKAQGLIRWLRPEYQAPGSRRPSRSQTRRSDLDDSRSARGSRTRRAALLPWPDRMAEQAQAVRGALAALAGPASAAQVAAAFAAAPPERVAELLETLVTLGQARRTPKGGSLQGSGTPRTPQQKTSPLRPLCEIYPGPAVIDPNGNARFVL